MPMIIVFSNCLDVINIIINTGDHSMGEFYSVFSNSRLLAAISVLNSLPIDIPGNWILVFMDIRYPNEALTVLNDVSVRGWFFFKSIFNIKFQITIILV